MAPTDFTQQPNVATDSARAGAMRRGLVYLVAVLAVVAAVWALIEGGERDLWTQPAALNDAFANAVLLL